MLSHVKFQGTILVDCFKRAGNLPLYAQQAKPADWFDACKAVANEQAWGFEEAGAKATIKPGDQPYNATIVVEMDEVNKPGLVVDISMHEAHTVGGSDSDVKLRLEKISLAALTPDRFKQTLIKVAQLLENPGAMSLLKGLQEL
jgi:hypothetical protein